VSETITKIDDAIRSQIADIEINLSLAHKYRNQNPNWKTSEGISIDEIISSYEFELAEARKCLPNA
jgi:hypothetical protein